MCPSVSAQTPLENLHAFRKPSALLAVSLALIASRNGGDGWESNPPRTPQQRPADGFEDRVFCVHHPARPSTVDQESSLRVR